LEGFRGSGFWLRDEDGSVVIRVIHEGQGSWSRWSVLGTNGEEVGSIVSALREFKRPRFKWNPKTGPWAWSGSVLIGFDEAATIEGGVVFELGTRRQLAALNHGGTGWPVVWWKLSISDGVEGPLRSMVLAWLGVAFDIQRRNEMDGFG
jgi:hypothetical protein